LAAQGFTPSVFSLDLPTKGSTHEERESYKRALNQKLINRMITQIPNESKYCVSYGQLKGCYWTIPATSTQGTTKEKDKDYIAIAQKPDYKTDPKDPEKRSNLVRSISSAFAESREMEQSAENQQAVIDARINQSKFILKFIESGPDNVHSLFGDTVTAYRAASKLSMGQDPGLVPVTITVESPVIDKFVVRHVWKEDHDMKILVDREFIDQLPDGPEKKAMMKEFEEYSDSTESIIRRLSDYRSGSEGYVPGQTQMMY